MDSRRNELRRKLQLYNNTKYSPLLLFDLWCLAESQQAHDGWQILAAHAIRELLEAFYEEHPSDDANQATQIVDHQFTISRIPSHLSDKFTVDTSARSLMWNGAFSMQDLSDIQKLSNSQAYKWSCYELSEKIRKSSVQNKLTDRVKNLLAKDDPLAHSEEHSNQFITRYSQVRSYFTKVSHCKGSLPSKLATNWVTRVSEAETLIFALVTEQVEIHETILQQIKDEQPSNELFNTLLPLIRKNTASFNLFFGQIDRLWLPIIVHNQLYELLPKIVRDGTTSTVYFWAPSSYLVRISSTSPKEVLSAIEGFKIDSETNPRVLEDSLECLSIIAETEDVSRILRKMRNEDWSQFNLIGGIAVPSIKLLDLFLKFDRHVEAAILLESLLGFREVDGGETRRMRPNLDSYYFRLVVDRLKHVSASDGLYQYVSVVCKSLDKIVAARRSEPGDSDTLFRGFELYEHEKYLTELLKQLLSNYFDQRYQITNASLDAHLNEIAVAFSSKELAEMLQTYMVLHRPKYFPQGLEDLLLTDKLFSSEYSDEILNKLSTVFSLFSEQQRRSFLNLLNSGWSDLDPENSQYVRTIYFKSIWNELTGSEKETFEAYKPNEKTEQSVDNFIRGPQSPLTAEQLEAMTIADLIVFLEDWQPKGGFGDDERRELGQVLRDVVQKSPSKFSADADKFSTSKIHPLFLSFLFLGFNFSLKDKVTFEASGVISLISQVCSDSVMEKLTGQDLTHRLQREWNSVFQYMADLLANILDKNLVPVDKNTVKNASNCISSIIIYSELQQGKTETRDNAEREPFDVLFNSVDGAGYPAFLSLWFYLERNNLDEEKELLKSQLTEICRKAESNYSISYLLGTRLPEILKTSFENGQAIIQKLLISRSLNISFACWTGYLSRNPFKIVFFEIEHHIKFFLDNLLDFEPGWKDHFETSKNLGIHLTIAYLFAFTDAAPSYLWTYFEKASPSLRASIIAWIGTSYLEQQAKEKNNPPPKKLFELWDWRLKVSTDKDELKQFGWWFRQNCLPDEEALDRLLLTLSASNGVIEPFTWVTAVIFPKSQLYPIKVLRCLLLMAGGKSDVTQISMAFGQGQATDVIQAAFASKDDEQMALASQLKNLMLKLGFTQYLN